LVNGKCHCNTSYGYFLHPSTGKCTHHCPTLFHKAGKVCEYDSTRRISSTTLVGAVGDFLPIREMYHKQYLAKEFEVEYNHLPEEPWFGSKDTPWFTMDRGFYFIGLKFLELLRLYPF
jgi:hypothetical protein